MHGVRRALSVVVVAAAIGCSGSDKTTVVIGDLQVTKIPDFGHVVLSRSTSTHLRLTNISRAPLTLNEIAFETPVFGDYMVDGAMIDSQAPFTLASGASRDLTLTFAPKMPGPREAKLDLHNNG